MTTAELLEQARQCLADFQVDTADGRSVNRYSKLVNAYAVLCRQLAKEQGTQPQEIQPLDF